MTINTAAKTGDFPRYREKLLAHAPQTVENTAETTGFTYLHFTNYDPDRQQPVEISEEYGDTDTSVDPTQVDFGDVSVSSPLQTRLCLNEIGYHLAHLFGAPVTTGAGPTYTHVFTSGKSELPYATIQDTDSATTRTARDVIYSSLALSLTAAGGVQLCDFNVMAKDLIMPSTAVTGGDVTASPSRLFVPQKNWRVQVGGTQIGKLLTANINYSVDMQTDRYIEDTDTVSTFYVGDPSLTLTYEVRHVSEAQRAALGGLDNAASLSLIGTGPSGSSITLAAPRVEAPKVFPRKDDKLQKLMFDGKALRVTGGSPEPMLTITLVNTVASY